MEALTRVIDANWLSARLMWSLQTFGAGQRTNGIVEHIKRELDEVLDADGKALLEWVDVILLAFDGAARAGFSGQDIIEGLYEKMKINEARKWPKISGEDTPTFHIKED